MATRDEMATSFGAQASVYQQGRPTYPDDAVAWMLERVPAAGRVIDAGAGTGKLTAVVQRVVTREVEAVDPDAGMLEQLRASVPDVPAHVGTAEDLPFDDASVDAVVMGQAWHWVDPERGSREIGRVLRPGGTLGLVWNQRDLAVEWVRELTDIMHASNAELMFDAGGPVVAAPFGDLEQRTWSWQKQMTRDELFAMARSRSYIITASPAERADIEQRMGELFDRIGAVGEQTVTMPYQTVAFRGFRSGQPARARGAHSAEPNATA